MLMNHVHCCVLHLVGLEMCMRFMFIFFNILYWKIVQYIFCIVCLYYFVYSLSLVGPSRCSHNFLRYLRALSVYDHKCIIFDSDAAVIFVHIIH